MKLRPATAADLPALHALIECAYRGDSARRGWTHEAGLLGGQRTDLAALEEIVADPAQHLLAAWDDDYPFACALIADKEEGLAYIGMITVDPARQAGGLGRQLMAAAETFARQFGATRMEMTVIPQRTELIAWYARRGYHPTGEQRPFPYGDERFGLPRRDDLSFIVLEKPLT